MKPTEEQQAILDATGRVLLVNARAGTGKTATLRMIAAAYPDRKILYLVFNRKAREEAEEKFPGNVRVRTVHSLAFEAKWKDQVGPFTVADMLPAFKGRKSAHQLAALSHDFLEFFMNSAFPRLEPALEVFQKEYLGNISEEVKKLFEGSGDRVIKSCREIMRQWKKKDKPCPHDFYLKLFHSERRFYQELNRFDMVLVDEGQDLSPIMLDALEHCRKRIVIVGDTHQQVYSFRYAIDAMKRFPSDEQRDLTMSFRFGRDIAEIASLLIREAKGEKGFKIRGNPQRSSSVSFYTDLPRPKDGERCAILSRTNLALFEKAISLRSRGIPFSLEGNVRGILNRILDVHWLSLKEHDKIRDSFIQSFRELESLETYARDLDDFQLAGIAKVVRQYARILPGVVFEMMDIKKSANGDQNNPAVILSTVHGAKGREYDRVYIDADIAASLSRPEALLTDAFGDEANIAYVGFTRAIRELHLPPDFKNILTLTWQTGIRRYEPAPVPRPTKPPFAIRKRASLPDLSGTEPVLSKSPRRRSFKVGDRVRTSHGTGTIVEINGGKYLVALDGQEGRLWEKEWGLKKA
ncbi:MAG: AAA family ATPase [Desulfobacterales bacterium]|nr:AAA family ATPase [Desulfobacterales bacterium]